MKNLFDTVKSEPGSQLPVSLPTQPNTIEESKKEQKDEVPVAPFGGLFSSKPASASGFGTLTPSSNVSFLDQRAQQKPLFDQKPTVDYCLYPLVKDYFSCSTNL